MPVFYTICLLSSSLTIHLAGKRLQRNESRAFLLWWLITIALGAIFMFGTAQELWEHLRDALAKQSPGDTNPQSQ